MTIFTFISKKLTGLIFLYLIMEELWKAKHMAEYFMYCLWTGRTCIFITKINFPDIKKDLSEKKNPVHITYEQDFSFLSVLRSLFRNLRFTPPHQILRFLSSFSTPASQSVWKYVHSYRLPGNAECPLRKHWQSWR